MNKKLNDWPQKPKERFKESKQLHNLLELRNQTGIRKYFCQKSL